MSYVDGFIASVPTENKSRYIEHATKAAAVFKDHGALQVVENWGDNIPDGEITSFPLAVKSNESETVVFSWVVWPSKETRDSGWQAIMDDPRMHPDENPMPFDGKRLIYGGFRTILDV